MPALADLVAAIPDDLDPRLEGDGTGSVRSVVLDSRNVTPGALFACLPGSTADGHRFAVDARQRGAVAMLVEHPVPVDVPQVVVTDARRALGWVAAAFEGHPSRCLAVCGITGTNGKTTTAHVLAHVLRDAGVPTGLLGTLSGAFTTAEAPDLQRALAGFRDEGERAVVMEVSSHALALHRVAGLRFGLAVFTNLGRDHLDFHGTTDAYFAAKRRLFEPDAAAVGVVWVDDPHGSLLASSSSIPVSRVGMADASGLVVTSTGSRFTWRGHEVHLPLPGRHNVANALLAASAATGLGVEAREVADGLATVPPVPGRVEAVDAGQDFELLVDFAHTPEALRGVLDSLRELAAGRLVVVFGCGGDRDPDKRPLMGNVAAERADLVVVTSDNPRSEDPEVIIDQVVAGVPAERLDRVHREPDRRAAIRLAVSLARPGDVVVVAGKGHETTQERAGQVAPFDDRVVAREALGEVARR